MIQAYWEAFRSSHSEERLPAEPNDIFAFGNTSEMATRLGALVMQGVKTATTSVVWAHEPGEIRPEVGHLSIVLDGAGAPLCIIEITEVRQLPFSEVGAVFAYDEGEGDRSLDYWRNAHRRFFSETLPQVGQTFAEDMPVLCERFRVIWPNHLRISPDEAPLHRRVR